MAFTCGFFNSVAHDRKYDAVQHGMIFDGIITDGIYATYLKAMVVKASENASEVIVQPGRAWFNHTWSYNDSDYPVAAPEPEVVLDRIDTLVLDVNSEDAVRNNQFLWVQGTPTSQTPEPPALIHTATHNQYPLCDVYRQAGTTMIYAADITNRVGTSDCPFVTGVLESINIDDLLAQWDDEFHTWENATKASFEGWMLNQQSVYTAWFNALKTQMAGDVADVEAWVQTIKDIIDEETATHLQLEIDEINSMLPSGSHITVTTSDTELYSRTVTITDEDNNTVTSQFDANGVAVFKSVPYVGNLTITSTDGVRTATEVVNTPYFARYEFTLAFWSATVNIIGDSVLGGDTVTITDSTTALVGTVVLNASGTGVFNATYPDTYKFSVTHGGETMEVSLAVTQETTYNVEIHSGLNYQAWLNAGRVSKSFSSLDEVLADEKTLRQLFLVHDAVDYVCNNFNVGSTADVTKIFNTDLAAKWINNSDYALDHFYAVADIKSIMDAADKYGYGEWVITDSTTTPATWGPKGNVPVMTANNAPYGTVSTSNQFNDWAPWYSFSKGTTKCGVVSGTTGYIQYKFTCPTKVEKVDIREFGNAVQIGVNSLCKDVEFYVSNDGTNFEKVGEATNASPTLGKKYTHKVGNPKYALYFRITALNNNGISEYTSFGMLQFYGRELKESVPIMTSDTVPFGEVLHNSFLAEHPARYAFDGNDSTTYYAQTNSVSDAYIGYKFNSKTCIKKVGLLNHASNLAYTITKAMLQGRNGDSDNWSDIEVLNFTSKSTWEYVDVSSLSGYKQIRLKVTEASSSAAIIFLSLQFYGLDYSEKEFEVGTTKKWLYDHGVEVTALTISGTGTKNSDHIQLKASNAQASATINTTAYTLMRGKAGAHASGTNQLLCGSGSSNFTTSNMPYNNGLNVSSINGSNAVGVKQTTNGIFDATEIWLE